MNKGGKTIERIISPASVYSFAFIMTIQVFDGTDNEINSMGIYCGRVAPKLFRSSTNTMLVRFQSDSSRSGIGFSAKFCAAERRYFS